MKKYIIMIVMITVVPFLGAVDLLNADLMQRWVASMEAVYAWEQSNLDGDMALPDFHEMGETLEISMMYQYMFSVYPELQSVVKEYGFSDTMEWAGLSARILYAMMALGIEDDWKEIQHEIEAQLDEIENNPYITGDQREMMREQMLNVLSIFDQLMDVNPEDIKAVRENAHILRRLEKFE